MSRTRQHTSPSKRHTTKHSIGVLLLLYPARHSNYHPTPSPVPLTSSTIFHTSLPSNPQRLEPPKTVIRHALILPLGQQTQIVMLPLMIQPTAPKTAILSLASRLPLLLSRRKPNLGPIQTAQRERKPLHPVPRIATLNRTEFLHEAHSHVRSFGQCVLLAETDSRTAVEG
jgi:hypothetical protein